jgi:hypothetical protein
VLPPEAGAETALGFVGAFADAALLLDLLGLLDFADLFVFFVAIPFSSH